MCPLPEVNPALAGKVQDPLAEFVNGIFVGLYRSLLQLTADIVINCTVHITQSLIHAQDL